MSIIRRVLALGLAAACTVSLAPTAQAESTRTTTLLCHDVGQVRVEVTGDLARGGRAKVIGSGPVQLTGLPGLTGRDASGSAVVVKPSGVGVLCQGETVRGKRLDAVLPASQVPHGRGGSVVDGQLTFTATVDEARVLSTASTSRVQPAALANNPAGYGPVTSFPYAKELNAYMAGRPGNTTVAYRKAGTSTIMVGTRGSATNVTASIVKVGIMATVMRRAQEAGRGLTAWEKSQLVPMIRQSDNAAASNLWNSIGGGPAMGRVLGLMGLRSTTPGPGGYWGLTVTNAPDQVVLVDHFARRNPVLNDSMRQYGLSLMYGASSWGVTAGPGTIHIKNGWLPRTDGWHVNSIGYVPNSYSIAVLTHANTNQATQTTTIEGVSRIVYKHRNDTTTPAPSGVRGDWNGDGRADVLGTKDGYLWVFPNRSGELKEPYRIGGGGWGAITWMGSPGDVNGDGRADLLARDKDGNLNLYWGTSSGVVTKGRVGHGWNGISAIITVGDFNGDGRPELLGRTATNELYLYTIAKDGTMRQAQRVGHGWGGMKFIVGVSHLNNDKYGDVVGVDDQGRMFGYTSTGSALRGIGQVGHGWTQQMLAGPGDLSGDGKSDLVRLNNGALISYKVDGAGHVYTMSTNPAARAEGFVLIT